MALLNKKSMASDEMMVLLKPLLRREDWLALLEKHWEGVLGQARKPRPTDKGEKAVLELLARKRIKPTGARCAATHLEMLVFNLGSDWESRYEYVPANLELYDLQLTIEQPSTATVFFRGKSKKTKVDGLVALTGVIADASNGRTLNITTRWISRPFWQAPVWVRDMNVWQPESWVRPHERLSNKGRIYTVKGHHRKTKRASNTVLSKRESTSD